MEILLWLAAPLGVTAAAALCVGWIGRPRDRARSEDRAKDQFAKALTNRRGRKPVLVAAAQRERSSGVAVRPSRRRRDPR